MPHRRVLFGVGILRGEDELGRNTLISPPAQEPLTTEEIKDHIRVDIADDNTLIGDYNTAARAWVEDLTGLRFITQTVGYVLDRFPLGRTITLPLGPVQSVTTVESIDQNGDSATQANTEYVVDIASEKARIVLKEEFDWPDPDADLQEANGVLVTYVVGFGLTGASSPQQLRTAVKMLVGHFYENREAVALRPGAGFETLPMGVQALIAPFRQYARRI